LGFVPDGWDESKMIKYRDPGFLYLCRQLRDNWLAFRGYTIKDLKWSPGQGGRNVSNDWTGLDEALFKVGGNPDPPQSPCRSGCASLPPRSESRSVKNLTGIGSP